MYYANRSAPVLADKRGEITKIYQPYSDCILDIAKSYDWGKVVTRAEAQAFFDQSWSKCELARQAGDERALAYVQQQQKLDATQARRVVDARRAQWAYILTTLIFQKAGHEVQMNEYIKDARSSMAPELDNK